MTTQEAELSKKAQETGQQQYVIQGNKMIVSSPEGIVLTYVGGQLVSSKTPAQVQLESQIAETEIPVTATTTTHPTITKETEEQIASGLQTQTKQALAGEQPTSFKITTPEAIFQASSGITPNYLAGATGSVIPSGYYQTETGQIAPVSQTFKTSTGQEFTAIPTGSSAQGYIWQTPYGEIRAEPGQLQKEIERTMSIQALTPMLQANLERDVLITEKASGLETGLAKGLYGWADLSTPRDLLSYATAPLFGISREQMQLQLWKGRKEWTVGMLEAGPVAGIGWESAKLGGSLFLATAGGPILGAVGSKVPSILHTVLTGAGLGLTTGLTAIGTIEAGKGFEEATIFKEPSGVQKFWSGAMLIGIGALGTKFVWETGVEPELKEFIIVRQTTKGFSVSKIEMRSDDAFAGTGKAVYDTKISGDEIVTKTDFLFAGKKVNDKLTIEIGYGEMEGKAVEKDLLYGSWKTNLIDLPGQTFVAEDISAALPNDRFTLSGWETATKSVEKTMFNEKVVGLSISEKMFEDEFKTVFKTAGKTRIQDIFSIDTVIDETKIPFEFFGGGGTSSKLIESGTPESMGIIKAVQKDVLGMHTRAALEFEFNKAAAPESSLIPTIFPLGKTETTTREDVLSIPKIKIEPLEAGAKELVLTPSVELISSGKQLTGLFEGPRTEKLFPDMTSDITSSIQLTTPIETQLETSISLTKTSLMTLTPIIPIITPFIEPIQTKAFFIPSFDFGGFGLEEPRRKGKSRSRSFFYTPSFVALSLGIYGKMPKFLTGLEIRPMLKGMRGL